GAVDEFFHMRTENARLREDNRRLLHWEVVARRLEHENASLKAILNTVAEPRTAFVTGRVIADAGSAFVRTVLINAGAREGVAKGQAVVTADGLVGRVVEVGDRTARILLLTDLNSRVPVVVEPTRTPAILAGDNSDLLRLTFLPDGARVQPGERIVTSGQGGMLPPGLAIGVVESVAEEGFRVQPFVEWHRLGYIRVLDYALAGVLPKTREAGQAGPLW
ncbi:MAG: rod shape-determining protein MreC, partial [Alphaproteobacteria bacterium]